MKKAFFGVVVLASVLLGSSCRTRPAMGTDASPAAEKPVGSPQKKLNHRTLPEEPSLAEKINRLILPEEPDVAGKTLDEAIDLLRVKARDADAASPIGQKGVNIVIISGGDTKLPDTFGLKLRDVPFAEALRHVTGQAGMKFRVDANAVVVTEAESEPPPPPLTGADASTERERRLLRSLSHRITPTVNLHDCAIEEAVEFLRVNTGCYDEAPPASISAPRNMVLHVRDNPHRRRITLDLQNISLLEALGYMAEMTGLKLSLRSSALVFSDHDLGPPPKLSVKLSPFEVRASQVIPTSVTFQGTTLADALSFLYVKIREDDPNHQNVIVSMRPEGKDDPVITLDLKEFSLIDILDHLALQCDRRLSLEGETFIFTAVDR